MVGKPALVPFILAAIPGTSAATVAQVIATEEAKLTASDGTSDDRFGSSVAFSGDTALAGAVEDDHSGGIDAGSAYVFVRNGTSWSEQAKLTASDASEDDEFGSAVALSGDTAVICAAASEGGVQAGSAYVFVRTGTIWTEQQNLIGSDVDSTDSFGNSVAISGDTVLIGAYTDDLGGSFTEKGSTYVFVRNGTTWTEQAKLTAFDAQTFDYFGVSVAVSGDTALVGAFRDNHAVGGDQGSAYVFVRNGTAWALQRKLMASDAGNTDWFGQSVSLSGDTAVIGAYLDDHAGGMDAGSAYVFVRSGTAWSEQQKLTASDASANDRFGYSVALSGDTAVVGAFLHDQPVGADAGSAYLYVRSGTVWTEEAMLTASDAEAADLFGLSVAASGDGVLVGAEGDDQLGESGVGSAYVFRQLPEPVSYCTAGTSASGCQALLSATGTASATAPSGFTISAATVEGQKDGLFFFSANGQQANSWGNGTSYQCVVPPVVRTPTMAGVGTIGLCDGSFALDLNALWCPTCPKPAKNPGPGATVQAQLWYRDPANTSNQTTSLSDAIEFVVGP